MKKTLFLLACLCINYAMFAQITFSAKITFTLSSVNGASDAVYMYESEAFSAATDETYDVAKLMNDVESVSKVVNLFAVGAWGNAASIAESSLEGLKLKFQANRREGDVYTITFSDVMGTPYYLKDSKVQDAAGNDSLTAIVAGGTYSFTQAVSTTEERFEIVKKPAEPAICHQYGNLIITGHKGAKVKVLDMADAVAIAETTLATDDEVISLSELTSGEMYQVVMDEETMIIRIQ